MLRDALSQRAQLASGVFHEELSPARRDTRGRAVPRRRRSEPARLHRIRRRGAQLRVLPPARAVRPALEAVGRSSSASAGSIASAGASRWRSSTSVRRRGIGADVVRLFEALGLFREPLAGLEPQLAHVEDALEAIALDPAASLTDERLERAGRRRARGAHAHPRGGVSAAASRSVPGGDGGRRSSRASRRISTRSTSRSWSTRASRLGFRVERPRGRADLRDRVRQRGARRQPARRARRLDVRRHVRPRGSGGGRDASTSSPPGTRSSKACSPTSKINGSRNLRA